MREVIVKVVDHRTYPGSKTSRNIKRDEFAMLYPDKRETQINFIFTHKKELSMPEIQASHLVRKYGEMIEIVGAEGIKLNQDEKQKYNVDQMKRGAMIKLASRMDIRYGNRMKNEVLREAIKKAIMEGVEPLSLEEYEIRKKERG